nr:hypothetical protein [Tanacetum cinerariifolium]
MIQETTEKIILIKQRIQAAQDRQKSYADRKQKLIEFEIGDRAMLKVSPWKGVVRFIKRGKLNPRCIRPFKVLAKSRDVEYQSQSFVTVTVDLRQISGGHFRRLWPLSKKQQREFYMSVLKSHSGWKTKHFKGERFKRKGLRLKQDSAKEVSEEDLKEMINGQVLTASLIFTTASVVTPYSRRKVAREMKEQLAREDQRRDEQIARDAKIARIHAEEELQMLIDGLDRNNETIAKYLQEQHTEMATKIAAQDLEIASLKAMIKMLEDKDGGGDEPSGEDATIKRRSLETEEEAAIEKSTERGSNDTDELINVLTTMDAATILTSGVQAVSVPPVTEIPTGDVPTGSGQFKMQKVWVLVDLPKRKSPIGTKWVYRNKKDERGIVVRNKARLVAQGHTQEEGINYEEVFAPVARIEAIRLFLAYASFMGFMVYQTDVKSAFLYRTIEKEVYVCQPLGFEDPDYPDKVYKVVKALYGLHQAPRAWYESLANYLLENSFPRGKIDQTLFIKRQKGDILIVQIYVDDIIFGSTNKDLCKAFEKLMKDKFQMSSMDGKSASTPIDTEKPLLKDSDGEDVDVYTYRLMIGSLMYLTLSRPDIMFADDVVAAAEYEDATKEISAEPTPPSPTPATTPPPQQDIIPSPSQEVRKEEKAECFRVKEIKEGGKIVELDADEDVTLEEVDAEKDVEVQERLEESQAQVYHMDLEHAQKVLSMQEIDEAEPAEVEEVLEVVTAAKLMTEVVTTATTPIIVAPVPKASAPRRRRSVIIQDPKEAATASLMVTTDAAIIIAVATAAPTITTAPSAARRREGVVIRNPEETATPSTIIHSEPKSKDKGKGIMVQEPKPLKKQAQIEQDEAYTRELEAKLNKNINWDEVIEHVKKKGRQDNAVLRYQALKRKPQTEAQARKNMMIYLKNMAGFKLDYFKGMSYDAIRRIFKKYFNLNVAFLEKTKEQLEEEESRAALKRKAESSEEKAAKKQKLDEEVEELRKHLQIVPNDDDDVYTEATPLALKVPVIDYEI